MTDLTIQQQRVLKVLERMGDLVRDDAFFADEFLGPLESMFDEILEYDGFGTEGQLDPRGDQRNGPWALTNHSGIEGVDE